MIDHFLIAYRLTLDIEGGRKLTDRSREVDPGGMTYSGISRVWWGTWPGWELIDEALAAGGVEYIPHDQLAPMVQKFYRVNFWNRIQGDRLAEISAKVAYKMFDTAVNVDVTQAVRLLQRAIMTASGEKWYLIVDGKLGPKTIEALTLYMDTRPSNRGINEEILLNCIGGEQYAFYKSLKHYPQNRGWFRRLFTS